MTSRLDTVSTETSGADSVPPSLAGWEETKENLKRGSSHHEAHRSSYGLAGRARPLGRRLDEALVLAMASWFNSLNGRTGCVR